MLIGEFLHDDAGGSSKRSVWDTLVTTLTSSSTTRLCQSRVAFIHQTTNWTCSFASLQIVVSALLQCDTYRSAMFEGQNVVPNVASLQQWIQRAWRMGYDKDGADYFHGRLRQGQRIGVTDITAMLRSDGVPTRIVDFRNNQTNFTLVERFCHDYFFANGGAPPRFPLILGTADHTVVVVGCWSTRGVAVQLLVFDPAMRYADAMTSAQTAPGRFYLKRASLQRYREFQIAVFGDAARSERLTHAGDFEFGGKLLVGLNPKEVRFGVIDLEEEEDDDVVEIIVVVAATDKRVKMG